MNAKTGRNAQPQIDPVQDSVFVTFCLYANYALVIGSAGFEIESMEIAAASEGTDILIGYKGRSQEDAAQKGRLVDDPLREFQFCKPAAGLTLVIVLIGSQIAESSTGYGSGAVSINPNPRSIEKEVVTTSIHRRN